MDVSEVPQRGALPWSLSGTFFIGLALLLLGTALAGFWPTFFRSIFDGTFDTHWIVVGHGIVFFGWLLLLLAQAGLASDGRVQTHQSVGRIVGIAWGVLVLISALVALFGAMLPEVGADQDPEAYAARLLFNFGFLTAFGALFGAGIAYRRRPAGHKRLMILATVGETQPANIFL